MMFGGSAAATVGTVAGGLGWVSYGGQPDPFNNTPKFRNASLWDLAEPESATAKPIELRPYQEKFLGNIIDAIDAGCRRLVGQMPTGAGKTVIAAALAKTALSDNNRLIFT